jgi:uncharacterized membrane protein YraQ (UPF0718 family)/copper chaperone CopZ
LESDVLGSLWEISLALAPWLLLGMVIAGLLHVLLPRNFIQRQLTGRWAVLKAVLLGVPLPLCSCGVIPAGLGLKKDGASDGATVGFLISTPQTGVDSILVSSAFLGWPFALFKVASAAVTGLIGGYLTDVRPSTAPQPASQPSAPARWQRGMLKESIAHSLEILRSIWHWILFGVIASALIETLVPEDFFVSLADQGSLIPVLAALAVSLPLYVCATASVPIAAALVAGGMPSGAALVFLMAGPATNIATIGAVYRVLGKRSLAIYLSTIIIGSIIAGIMFDSVVGDRFLDAGHSHGGGSLWEIGSVLILGTLIGGFALGDVRRFITRLVSQQRSADERRIEVGVSGMTCGGCASKLERALQTTAGVSAVEVTVDPGKAIVSGSIDENHIRQVVEELGFGIT